MIDIFYAIVLLCLHQGWGHAAYLTKGIQKECVNEVYACVKQQRSNNGRCIKIANKERQR